VLLEWAAMAEWLVARLPEWEKDWQAHREALRAAGDSRRHDAFLTARRHDDSVQRGDYRLPRRAW
jgi:hypothetical protein